MTESKGNGGTEFRSSIELRTGLIQGATFGVKAVQYAVVDGQAMFEGDIVLGSAEQMVAQTDYLRQVQSGAVAMGIVRPGDQYRWPDCTIPYDIDAGLPNQARVTDAIAHWEANTRFRFVRRTPQNAAQHPNYVTFRPGNGCSSHVGKIGGQQFITLAAGCNTGSTIHEIGHAVGLWHEQSREDRDAFVTIHWDKIQAGMEHNFNQHINDGDDVGAYDYGSIMHYPRTAFSVDGSDTITPVNAGAQIGQRNGLSPGDIAAANSLCPNPGPVGTRIETVKEMIKDVRVDTRKEIVNDTKKEIIRDKLPIKDVKEPIRDPKPIKEAAKDVVMDPLKGPSDPVVLPGKPGIGGGAVGPRTIGGGAVPFAVVTPQRAPSVQSQAAEDADTAVMLDAQLQALAEAIAQAEATRNALQQQYDEIAALLQQTLDAVDPSGS